MRATIELRLIGKFDWTLLLLSISVQILGNYVFSLESCLTRWNTGGDSCHSRGACYLNLIRSAKELKVGHKVILLMTRSLKLRNNHLNHSLRCRLSRAISSLVGGRHDSYWVTEVIAHG